MSNDTTSEKNSGERKVGPTVTKDRWVSYARQKLSKGYVLIVSASRKNANFYSPAKGYEMCAYDVARKLIADGLIVKTRAHHLGDVYELTSDAIDAAPAPAPPVIDDDDDDLDGPSEFLDDIPKDDEEGALDDEDEEDEVDPYAEEDEEPIDEDEDEF